MTTPHRSQPQKRYGLNKENISSSGGVISPRHPYRQKLATVDTDSEDEGQKKQQKQQQHGGEGLGEEEYDGEEEGEEDGIPFVGLSERDVMALKSIAARKERMSGGYRRWERTRGGGRVAVLRDVTGEFVNREGVGRTAVGKGKVLEEVLEDLGGGVISEGEDVGDVEDVQGIEILSPEEVEDFEEEEEQEQGQEAEEEEELVMTVIESDIEADDEQLDVGSDIEVPQSSPPLHTTPEPLEDAIEGSDASSILTTSSLGFNPDDNNINTHLSQPPRSDNIALRRLLHPSSYADLRSNHLSDISLSQKWHLRRRRLVAKNPGVIHQAPPKNPKQIPYRRPNRKIPRSLAKPAGKLWRHLGLYDPESKPARKLLGWLRKEDELLLSQVSLVAPRMQFQHIREVHEHAFQPLRVQLLEYLRKNFENCTWCLFFSEFVYANLRHQLGNNDTTVNGSCLFLMVSTEKTGEIKKVAEGMLKNLKFGDELAVFVRTGNPRLYGSYGLRGGDEEYEDSYEELAGNQTSAQNTSKSGVRIGWPNLFQKSSETDPKHDTTQNKPPHTPSPPPNSNSSDISSWIPSPTPSPHSPVANIRSIHWDRPIYWRDLDAFTYGLRWVTKLAIPSAEEGENSKYYDRPDLGSSLSAKADFGSGTLAGYLSDKKGVVYAMTCHHVLYFIDSENVWPMSSNAIKDSSASQPIAPSATDLKHQTRATAHQIDGLMHESICAYTRGNKDLAKILTAQGKEKLLEHDKLVEKFNNGGAEFGGIVASAWKIAKMKDGKSWIMDQVVFKPKADRIGTNTFTYTGRDNKGGRRYRLEARGWTDLSLGAEVLKIGRTTGLTKGSVISLDADIRILVGEDQQQFPKIHRVQRFWEVRSGIITSGTGPWFSEPGDSGSWILANPSFEDMLKWDLRRTGGKKMADPIPAPVGGMLFGGADSVDGINLTFYNPTKVVRKYLVEMLGARLGRELKPGFGGEVIPPPLSSEWEEQDSWSRQSAMTADAWAGFVDSGFWGYQLERYSNRHVFRSNRWWEEWDRRTKGVAQDSGLYAEKGRKYDTTIDKPSFRREEEVQLTNSQKKPSTLKVEFAENSMPRRRGTDDGSPDTPVSTRPKIKKFGSPYLSTGVPGKEVTPGKYTSSTGRIHGGSYGASGVEDAKLGYKVNDKGKKKAKVPVIRVKDESQSDDGEW
ncbi:hypothetical protein TWF718_009502 [Orbilia javanica]|uniref:Uncharacterized protein n=1 Tax=Orbilia javanica TaxID=47235 RepID=A0AAN8MSM4_9PEZI